MGRPKAWLEFDGRPLLAHLVDRMLAVFPEVVVVGAADQSLPHTPARIVRDARADAGPVAGLEAGLGAVSHPLAFAASCDAPFLSPTAALLLVDRIAEHSAVAPRWGGQLQPLHAVYRTSALPVMTRQLDAGRRRTTDLLQVLDTRIVEEDELREADPAGLTFLNMNSPEDYRRAQELWRELG